jgi:hypothetical protein
MGVSSLMDMHCRLSKRYDEVTLRDRHNPYSEFRQNVSKLVSDARGLLNDTLVNFSYTSSFNLNLIIPIDFGLDNNSAAYR